MLNKVLFEAVKGRQAGVVSAVLKRIDNVDQADGEGMTALMMASRDVALSIVKLLLKAVFFFFKQKTAYEITV